MVKKTTGYQIQASINIFIKTVVAVFFTQILIFCILGWSMLSNKSLLLLTVSWKQFVRQSWSRYSLNCRESFLVSRRVYISQHSHYGSSVDSSSPSSSPSTASEFSTSTRQLRGRDVRLGRGKGISSTGRRLNNGKTYQWMSKNLFLNIHFRTRIRQN